MKFLADMGISRATLQFLKSNGYDCIHLRDEGLIKLADTAILEKAKIENRIVLTCDLDFGDILAANQDSIPSVIIFRLSNFRPSFLNPLLLQILREKSVDLTLGAVIIVEDSRYRVRKLPITK